MKNHPFTLLHLSAFVAISLLVYPKGKQVFGQTTYVQSSATETITHNNQVASSLWGAHARMFKNPPAFSPTHNSWQARENSHYHFEVISMESHERLDFWAASANSPLSPVWDSIPNGQVYLKVEAVDTLTGQRVLVLEKLFYKAASFRPPYPAAKHSYAEALAKGLDFMYHQPHIQAWLTEARPNHALHPIYCYSALEVGSVVNAMVLYHKHHPQNDTALLIARRAANYLITHREPAGAPLAGFPQVYEGTHLAAARFQDEIILTEPAATGLSFLALFGATHDSSYLEAALDIAEAYRRTQLPEGTWPVRLSKTTGKPTTDVLCIPMKINNFLQLLVDQYHVEQYQSMIKEATRWTFENPVKTWDWTGQFEDVDAVKPYENLTKYEASWFAQYLLKHQESYPEYQGLATALIDFCEDQFVVWEQPNMYDNWGYSTQSWHLPAVLEQYHCYVPIDASAVQMIDTYHLAWQKTGKAIYLAKAEALANSLMNIQEDNGRIPTFWADGFDEFWNNCMVSSLMMLDRMVSE